MTKKQELPTDSDSVRALLEQVPEEFKDEFVRGFTDCQEVGPFKGTRQLFMNGACVGTLNRHTAGNAFDPDSLIPSDIQSEKEAYWYGVVVCSDEHTWIKEWSGGHNWIHEDGAEAAEKLHIGDYRALFGALGEKKAKNAFKKEALDLIDTGLSSKEVAAKLNIPKMRVAGWMAARTKERKQNTQWVQP